MTSAQPPERYADDQHAWATLARQFASLWVACGHDSWERCSHAVAAERYMERLLEAVHGHPPNWK